MLGFASINTQACTDWNSSIRLALAENDYQKATALAGARDVLGGQCEYVASNASINRVFNQLDEGLARRQAEYAAAGRYTDHATKPARKSDDDNTLDPIGARIIMPEAFPH
jgi:hypothetical protein